MNALLVLLAGALLPASAAWACTPAGYGTPVTAAAPPEPAMTVLPGSGTHGTSVRIEAAGSGPMQSVDVHLASESGERTLLGTGTTDQFGLLAAVVTIPDVPAGLYAVVAGARGGGTFEVTAPPPTPLIPTAPAPAQPVPDAVAAWVPGAVAPPASQGPAQPQATTSGDTRAPRVSVRLPADRRLAAVLRRGLVLGVGCSEACRIEARAMLGHDTARRLGLPGALARRSAALDRPGRTRLVMRLAPGTRAKLGGVRALTLNVVLTVTDGAGNATVVRAAVRLRR